MKEQKKKLIVAALLLLSCLICGYLLISADYRAYRLKQISTADSLIQNVISDFDIGEQQINISSTRVDSNFKRKTYRVGVPYQFSKTQFHAELNNLFYAYGVQTPTTVDFPQEDFTIQLLYNDTVIRTILLQTDPKLAAANKKQISLLITFDGIPSTTILNQLKQLGEPIPIVLKITNPMQANQMREEIASNYDHIIYRLYNDQGTDLLKTNQRKAVTKLTQLQEILPNATMLFYSRADQQKKQQTKQLLTQSNITFVDATDALMLHERMGKTSFVQSLEQLQLKESASMAVINGTRETIDWLNQQIPRLKKAGITITAPPQENN
ncbi:hypothetical protein LX73_2063 [Fodinibius salinus]|uniref:Uncharacterized protein n=1 Tax=Fodinibius salinus TaxID=860790 RepID=A0A5D3YJL5_9BACT|nr:hypothetical protein [Fodinibius salinus]TYP92700.1 hypothetical protein LX73_2063 [Fodinibius salinus]